MDGSSRAATPLRGESVKDFGADDGWRITGTSQRSEGVSTRWERISLLLLLGALAASLAIGAFGPAASSAAAAPTTMVQLGQASTYAVLSGASVGNTVNAAGAPHTTLRGDLGVKASTPPTGFPPGVVTGTTRVGESAAQAHGDLVAAYEEVAGRTGGAALAGQLAGLTLSPGLHTTAAAVSNTGTVTLDGGGDPDAVFVFKIGGALTMAAGARVALANGARASRVFWQVNGAAAVGANARFAGTLMALDAIAIGAGTEVNGRALSRNGAISLDSNEFYSAPPVISIAGGATAITTDTTPTISGTTDVEVPGVVSVTIAGQTLTVTPSSGEWSLTAAILANGTYPVVASVSDAVGNEGSTTQQLTVDTVPPLVTIDGGLSQTTNDPTPTITGSSDQTPGTVVRVSFGSQAMTALVQSGGIWNATPTALSDGTRTITASVTDPAGNESSVNKMLTIDTAPPAVTIAGGASALTNDATPDIAGTADVAPGRTVTVNLADQTLTGPVQGGGAWSVTAAALSDGPHRVVMSVADEAGNPASSIQTLSVDTVAPVVAITGGATARTSDLQPTISGTSNATAGTTVNVSIAGQTMTTLVQADGTWNATPTFVGEGTWPVVASASDPAGNVGSITQTLAIATEAPSVPPTPAASGGVPINATPETPVAGDGSEKVSGAGDVTLTAAQLRINQRISQAAVRRINALQARVDGVRSPPSSGGSQPAAVTLSVRQLRINQRISQAAVRRVNSLTALVEGRSEPSAGPRQTTPLALSAQQLRINQRISQAAVRRVNALVERIPELPVPRPPAGLPDLDRLIGVATGPRMMRITDVRRGSATAGAVVALVLPPDARAHSLNVGETIDAEGIATQSTFYAFDVTLEPPSR